MRKIKIESWKANVPVKDETGKVIEVQEADENLLVAINMLIGGKKPEEMPRGLDKFRLFNRLAKAFDKADKSKLLVLEEIDYKFIKDIIEKDVPSAWGFNSNLNDAIESFLNAKEE